MPRHLFRKEDNTYPQFTTTMKSAQARKIIAMMNVIVAIGLDLPCRKKIYKERPLFMRCCR